MQGSSQSSLISLLMGCPFFMTHPVEGIVVAVFQGSRVLSRVPTFAAEVRKIQSIFLLLLVVLPPIFIIVTVVEKNLGTLTTSALLK